jgi:TP901 family phage tail tape measure protein
MDLFTLGVKADTSQLKRGERDLDSFAKTGKRVENQVGNMVKAIGAATAAISTFLATSRSIQTITSFEDALLGLNAVTRATTADMATMEKQARSLGATSVFSATEAANAQKFLAQAGFDVNEVLSATPTALRLAQAGSLDLAQAADIASNVLGGMRLEVDQFNRVADVMAETAARSNTNITQLGDALSYAAPVASGAGVSIELASAAIGKLSDAGLQGTRAGTGLLGVIRQLSAPSKEAAGVLQQYGLTLDDVNIQSNGLQKVLERTAKAGFTTSDMFKIFGSEAQPAAAILMDNVSALEDLNAQLGKAEGAADAMAKVMSSGLSAAFKGFNSQVGESILQLGDSGLTKSITDATRAVTGLLAVYNGMGEEFAESNELTKEQYENLVLTADILEIAGGAAIGAATAYGIYRAALIAATLKQVIFNGAVAANPIGAAVVALGLASGALLTYIDRTRDAKYGVDDLTESVKDLSLEQLRNSRIEVEKQAAQRQARLKELRDLRAIEEARLKANQGGLGSSFGLGGTGFSAKLGGIDTDIQNTTESAMLLNGQLATIDQQIEELSRKPPIVIEIKSGQPQESILPTEADIKKTMRQYGLYQQVRIDGEKEIADIAETQIDWEGIGATAAGSITNALIDGDWTSAGNQIGSTLGSSIGMAMGGPIGAAIGGAIGGSLFGSKKKTGSSTTVGLSGGNASGSTTTNFSKSGLFGGSSSVTEDLGLKELTQLNNSLNYSFGIVDQSLSKLTGGIVVGFDEFNRSVNVAEGDLSGAIDQLSDEYVNANVSYIEDFQRVNETAFDALKRLSSMLASVQGSFEIVQGDALENAAGDFIARQADAIRAGLNSQLSLLQSQLMDAKSNFEANAVIVRQGLDAGYQTYEKARSIVLRELQVIESLEPKIAELSSRIPQAMAIATAQFTNGVLGTIAHLEGINQDEAADVFAQLAFNYEENYYSSLERVQRATERARDELAQFSDLGISADMSMTEFRTAFEAFINSSAFTPQGYSRFLLAADALADLNEVTQEVDDSGALKSITDFVRDLMGLAADGTQTLASAKAAYDQALTASLAGDDEALGKLSSYADNYLKIAANSLSTSAQLAGVRANVIGDLTGLTGSIPAYANGTSNHSGGWAMVGERGAELVNLPTGSSVTTASNTAKMLDNSNLLDAVNQLINIMQTGQYEIAKAAKDSYKIFNGWNKIGLPAERVI